MNVEAGLNTNPPEPPTKRFNLKQYFLIFSGILIAFVILLLITVLSLRWINPPSTAFTLREDWDQLETERYNLREYWIPDGELPDHLKWAVIASEDQRFYVHWGLDIQAIETALEERRDGVRQRGASTITQQTAKNLFLSPAESFLRKGIEAVIAVMIELFWTKERILEVYLNIAEFGPGIFGVGKAAGEFFGIIPIRLEPDASARLAAVLPSPKRMRVEPPSPYTEERSLWILRQMSHLTGISYLPDVEPDTLDTSIDIDPLPWDFDMDLELTDPEAEISDPDSDSIFWDDIPDSLLRPDW
jgi:monofunctional glycosyltransferase